MNLYGRPSVGAPPPRIEQLTIEGRPRRDARTGSLRIVFIKITLTDWLTSNALRYARELVQTPDLRSAAAVSTLADEQRTPAIIPQSRSASLRPSSESRTRFREIPGRSSKSNPQTA